MKKLLALFLALLAMLSLCACGQTEESAAEAPEQAVPETAEEVTAGTDGDVEVETVDDSEGEVYVLTEDMIAADEAGESTLDEEMFAAAQECVGEEVEALYAAIGEPDATEYASSCLDLTGEDGELFYDRYGFYVWTLKNADGETVQDVREN